MCRWNQLMTNILQAEETNHNPKIQNAGHNQESCWIHFYGPHIYGRNWWHPNAPLAAMTRGAISSHPDARCNMPDHLEREGVYSSVGLLRQPNNYAMWVLIKILGEPHILIFFKFTIQTKGFPSLNHIDLFRNFPTKHRPAMGFPESFCFAAGSGSPLKFSEGWSPVLSTCACSP